MRKAIKINGTEEAWDSGLLGQNLDYAEKADSALQNQVEHALGMQSISIRLQTELINEFKLIAKLRGTGYQPLMRKALHQFAHAELKKMAIEYANNQKDSMQKNDKKTGAKRRLAA